MKQTPADLSYAAAFGQALAPHFRKQTAGGMAPKEFAERLGVSRSALQKYLRGAAMPSFRTIVLAYRWLRILLPYEGVSVTDLVAKRPSRNRLPEAAQMTLPLTLEVANAELDVSVQRKAVGRYQLQLAIKKAV